MRDGCYAVWKRKKIGQNVKNLGDDTKMKTVPVTFEPYQGMVANSLH